VVEAIGKKGIGSVTKRHAVRVLHTLYEDAINDEYCNENPASGVKVPADDAKQRRSLSETEVEALVNVGLVDSPIREIVLFMLATGTRVGEACGVRWHNENGDKELDLDALTVTISGQLQRVGGGLIRKRTKTNQYRVLAIPAWLGEVLSELRSRHLIEGVSDPEGLVFLNPEGRRVDQKWLHKHLQAACAKAGFPKSKHISAHVLRHTFATIGMAKTGNLHAVQKALGHSQVALTANLYSHASLEGSKQISDAIGDVIRKRDS
jgi:integrase